MVKRKRIDILSMDELNRMHTGSLLSRLHYLRKCYETKNDGDDFVFGIVSKDQDEWKLAYDQVREVLSTREHYLKKTRRMK